MHYLMTLQWRHNAAVFHYRPSHAAHRGQCLFCLHNLPKWPWTGVRQDVPWLTGDGRKNDADEYEKWGADVGENVALGPIARLVETNPVAVVIVVCPRVVCNQVVTCLRFNLRSNRVRHGTVVFTTPWRVANRADSCRKEKRLQKQDKWQKVITIFKKRWNTTHCRKLRWKDPENRSSFRPYATWDRCSRDPWIQDLPQNSSSLSFGSTGWTVFRRFRFPRSTAIRQVPCHRQLPSTAAGHPRNTPWIGANTKFRLPMHSVLFNDEQPTALQW